MVAIFLTRENINFLKSGAPSVTQEVKSSHLTETIAFGLGYRTHASLLAAIASADSRRPLLSNLDIGRLSERLHSLGYPSCDLTDFVAISRSCNLPDRLWARFPSSDIGMNDRWFRECRSRNIPNVCIKTRRKYVELYWDCISIDPRDDAHVRGDAGNALMRNMFQAYQNIANKEHGKSIFFGSSFVGTIDDLLPTLAEEIADTFFEMLYEPLRRKAIAA